MGDSERQAHALAYRITRTDGVCASAACIRGTRITVWLLWHLRDHFGASNDEILAQYPELSLDDLHAAWRYATEHTEEIERYIRHNNRDMPQAHRSSDPATSAQGDEAVTASGKRAKQVKRMIEYLGKADRPLTAREIGRAVGIEGGWKRMHDAEEIGLAVPLGGSRKCEVSGHTARTWITWMEARARGLDYHPTPGTKSTKDDLAKRAMDACRKLAAALPHSQQEADAITDARGVGEDIEATRRTQGGTA